jgi:signal transduction histidine kinase
MSRRVLLTVGWIALAVVLAATSTHALAQRADGLQSIEGISADLAGLDLIAARTAAMEEADRLRLRLIEQGWAGFDEVDVGPAVVAAGDLFDAAAVVAEGDGPLAAEASVLQSTLEQRLAEGPDTDSYVDMMGYLDDLVGDFCCAGQTGSIRGVSDPIRTLDYLAYAQGTYSYFLDDFVGGLHYQNGTPIETGGFSDYMAYNADLARAGSSYADVDDPLTTDFPPQLQQDEPARAEALAAVLDSAPAHVLRRSVAWAVQGGAAAGEPAPATFEEVVASIESVQADLGDYVAETISSERAALAARVNRLHGVGWMLLGLALVGYLAAGALIFTQIRAIRRVQIQVELQRREAQAKLNVLSVVAHEMRIPLTGISGFSQTLLHEWQTLDKQEIDEFLTIINAQAAELARLIDDLLTLGRLETGRLELHSTEVGVAELARQVAKEVFPDAPHPVLTDLDPELRVVCDPDRVRQMLRNLLDNARKYGGPIVRVAADRIDGWCRISVIDDGDGVAPNDVTRIFNRFDRGSAPPTAAAGFGLGLSIVKDLARAMGGEAGCSSAVPRGTEFWVELPLPALD